MMIVKRSLIQPKHTPALHHNDGYDAYGNGDYGYVNYDDDDDDQEEPDTAQNYTNP